MRRGRAGIVVVGLLAVVAAGWTSAWAYAAYEAGQQLDLWLKAEAAQGRAWTCPDRAIGGYPFALDISCSNPTFTAQAMGQGVEAQIAHLTAKVALWHPRKIALTLGAPFSYRTSDDTTNVGATWNALTLDLDGLPDIATVALKGEKIAVSGTFGDQGRQSGTATRLDARFVLPDSPSPSAADADPTLTFDIAADGLPIAPLDALVGGTDPADVALSGRLDRADVGDARTPEEAIEHWREAHGQIVLDSSRISRAGAKVTATGILSLDDAHRPKGKLDAQFVGLGPILKRYGISGDMAAAGSLLSTLFGGGKPAAPTEPGALALPISLRNGHLGVGPIDTGIAVPPLY
ncbi:hypothetical protein RHAL1_00465 [Beijerinckiaceae bacterium RH AL1]|nr:DUF2125 domain-containing protein [Beijerinckiaceae bacterium]VVB42939.1 hypothetical protein RHAL8_00440 [Beijerinckiaceae bacterium RH AL8]VVB42952.1 hypothetical protein RHCH11_RHCH11_00442 [Beijerinckiaceae bacterium RH CH11]VVC53584.1 hypothetical protein RHAL1_00465 [Beijerinckiaceae bacterium RH AL1]